MPTTKRVTPTKINQPLVNTHDMEARNVSFVLVLDGKRAQGAITLYPHIDGGPGFNGVVDGGTVDRLRGRDDRRAVLAEIKAECLAMVEAAL